VSEKLDKLLIIGDRSGEAINIRDRFKGMNPQEVIVWAERFIREEESVVAVNETVKAWPLDGALALWTAAREQFGWTQTKEAVMQTMFGQKKVPSTEVAVEVEYGKYVNVPWGGLGLPGVEGDLQCGASKFDGMPCFVVKGEVKKKSLGLVTNLVNRAREIVAERSIYKGKALIIEPALDLDTENQTVLQNPPKFFKVNGINKDDLVLPEAVRRQVNTAVFSMIEDAEEITAAGLPTKRTIVLNGKPGTGKTLTMTIAAGLCIRNGRTFMLLKDIDFLEDTIKMANVYNFGKTLIAAEDIDRRMNERDDQANRLLNAIDGVDSKKLDIQFLLTTNHKEELIETFQRAGRSDWIIDLPVPDATASAALLKRYATESFKVSAAEYAKIGKILADAGTLPANIAEVARRVQYYQIAEKTKHVDAGMLEVVAMQVIEEKGVKVETVVQEKGMLERIAEDVQAVKKVAVN
jgi:ATPase family associated with various cellular activities (AAA)